MSLKNTIIGLLFPKLNRMTLKPVYYEFDYEGEFEALDSVSILNAHLNFINLLVEIKSKISPESKLNVGLKGFNQGSLEIQHVVELIAPVGLFAINNYDVIKNLVEIFSDVLKLKAAIGAEKPVYNEIGNNKVSVTVNGNNNTTIVINAEALKQYQDNPIVSKLMSESAKYLSSLDEVKSLELRSSDSKMPSLKMNREELMTLSEPNPYLGIESDFQIYEKAVLYVRKADFNPKKGKKCIWQFVHKGRDISATIMDEAFISSINQGAAFGQGYRIVADLKAHKRYDKSVGTYVENKKYDVTYVYSIHPREDTIKADI